MEAFFTTENLIALVTLTSLEIVLGIDNVIFIAILAGKVHPEKQDKARRLGIAFAVLSRILLLLSLSWLMGLTRPMFEALGHSVTGKDLVLLFGGLFLIGKSTFEIHDKLEGAEEGPHAPVRAAASLVGIVIQISIVDIVFSLDSVITAVGMSRNIPVMIVAVVVAAAVMLVFSGAVSRFVSLHPTMKMLALSFLILIGVMLVAESFGRHVERGYIYFAMAFSFSVELVNLRLRKRVAPVELRHNELPGDA